MKYLIADVETFGTDPKNGKLLGVALCWSDKPDKSWYHAINWYSFKDSMWDSIYSKVVVEGLGPLRELLTSNKLIGHNYAYDKSWLDQYFRIDTQWHACTRLMWHIASTPSGPRPYGLKDAQVEVLGWEGRGDEELEEQVRARGGSLKNGDHYLADLEILSKYACMDASSTASLYNHLAPFYDKHDYWWMLEKMVKYSWLLQECTDSGVRVDTEALNQIILGLTAHKDAHTQAFMEEAKVHIERLERIWKEDRATKYTLDSARQKFLASWDMQKKFKLSSDKDKRELFYDCLGLKTIIETEGGKPSTSVEAIQLSMRGRTEYARLLEHFKEAESAETLLTSFAKPWLNATRSNRLHPRFNPCGTVSYRLSGFKPYLLNAPFDEKELMSCLKCDEGWEGIHADFVSVEPAVTAHYSQDPNLLKVFRDQKGDVYLDLARTLFPENQELQNQYDPMCQITSSIKDRFKKERGVAKILHLAMQYGGTEYTIEKNLSYAGYETTLGEAKALVRAYWKHFHRVKVMNESLFRRFEKQGYLRNAVGRIIRVPTSIPIRKRDGTIWDKPIPRYKDLPNRFIQSSAHDLLSFWVLNIDALVRERGLRAKPLLIDCHDSTSWQAPIEESEALRGCFNDALTQLNEEVKLSVPIRAEIKRFQTLAGLKGEE